MTEEENQMIDRYLSGSLPEGERVDFEQLLADNVALRDRVSLRRNLTTYFSNDEAKIADLLGRADQKHFEPSNVKNKPVSTTSTNWWWLLLILLALTCLGWWLTSRSAENAPLLPPPEPRSEATSSVLDDTLTPSKPDAVLAPAPQTKPAPAAAPPKVNTPQTEPAKLPEIDLIPPQPTTTDTAVFAELDLADFKAYPMLENMVDGQLRGGVDSASLVFVPAVDTISLATLQGLKLQGYATVEPPYDILVFDNREQNFIEDQPVLRQRTEGLSEGEGYLFEVNLSTLTRTGRFYVLVLDEEGELIMGKVVFVRQ
jgi:hypothetical protein